MIACIGVAPPFSAGHSRPHGRRHLPTRIIAGRGRGAEARESGGSRVATGVSARQVVGLITSSSDPIGQYIRSFHSALSVGGH